MVKVAAPLLRRRFDATAEKHHGKAGHGAGAALKELQGERRNGRGLWITTKSINFVELNQHSFYQSA